MPNYAIDDFISVNYDALIYGQQFLFTYHYKIGGTLAASPTYANLWTAIRNAYSGAGGIDEFYANIFTPDVSDIKLVLQAIHPTRYVRDTAFSSSVSGIHTIIGQPLPQNTAAALVFRADTVGRHDRGTKHILLTDSDDVSQGIIQSQLADRIRDFADKIDVNITLPAPAAGVVLIPVIYRRDNPTLSSSITNHAIMSTARVMRRRTVGQGT